MEKRRRCIYQDPKLGLMLVSWSFYWVLAASVGTPGVLTALNRVTWVRDTTSTTVPLLSFRFLFCRLLFAV